MVRAIAEWYGDLGVAQRRILAHKHKEELAAYVKSAFNRHDVSKSGGLTYSELKSFLKELQPNRIDDITEAEASAHTPAVHGGIS